MLRFDMVGLRYDRPGGSRRDSTAGPEVLHNISFHVQAGAFRWLLGPSGAGKTSMLRLLYLAVRPTSGHLTLLGTDVATAPRRALPALRRRIGVVFQDFRLLPHMSTFDNVALPLRLAGRPEGQIRADVTELLRWVGLAPYLDVPPLALSGGEQQRVAIARAVITRPALLLADEPTGNLDDGQAERLMKLFKEMNRIGTTVIVATHNEALVARHPAPALRIAEGRLVGSGAAPERRGRAQWDNAAESDDAMAAAPAVALGGATYGEATVAALGRAGSRQAGLGQTGLGQAGLGQAGLGQTGLGQAEVGRAEVEQPADDRVGGIDGEVGPVGTRLGDRHRAFERDD